MAHLANAFELLDQAAAQPAPKPAGGKKKKKGKQGGAAAPAAPAPVAVVAGSHANGDGVDSGDFQPAGRRNTVKVQHPAKQEANGSARQLRGSGSAAAAQLEAAARAATGDSRAALVLEWAEKVGTADGRSQAIGVAPRGRRRCRRPARADHRNPECRWSTPAPALETS